MVFWRGRCVAVGHGFWRRYEMRCIFLYASFPRSPLIWVTSAPVPLWERLRAGTYRSTALVGADKLAMPSLNGSVPNGCHQGSERKPFRRLSGYQVRVYLPWFRICLPPVAVTGINRILSWLQKAGLDNKKYATLFSQMWKGLRWKFSCLGYQERNLWHSHYQIGEVWIFCRFPITVQHSLGLAEWVLSVMKSGIIMALSWQTKPTATLGKTCIMTIVPPPCNCQNRGRSYGMGF